MTCGIYCIRNLTTEKKYVGSSKNIEKRWTCHKRELRGNKHHSRYLQRAWNKYGESDFTFSVLEQCQEGNLIEREQYHMDLSGAEFNVSDRAGRPVLRTGIKLSEEHKRKISAANMGRCQTWPPPMLGRHHTEEAKRKMRVAKVGNKNCLGRACLADTRRKIGDANRGRPISENARIALMKCNAGNQYNLGRHASDETRQKIALANIGRVGRRGWHHSEESRRKISLAQIGKPAYIPSPETRKKMSDSHRGKRLPPEQIEKIRIAGLGRRQTTETRKRISDSNIGKHFHSTPDETRKKIGAGVRRYLAAKLTEQDKIPDGLP